MKSLNRSFEAFSVPSRFSFILCVRLSYAVGEILDVVGRCGGYNLQWAWSSAQQVGEAISRSPRLERVTP